MVNFKFAHRPQFVTSPPVGGQSVAISVSVCPQVQFHRIFCTHYLWPWLGAWSSSDGNAICYVLPVLWMTSMFSHNGANGPESKTKCHVSSSSPAESTRGEVCRIQQHLVTAV